MATITDIEQIVVGRNGSEPILIRDVAEVAIGKELRTGAATRDGKESVLGMAMMLMGKTPALFRRLLPLNLQPLSRHCPMV